MGVTPTARVGDGVVGVDIWSSLPARRYCRLRPLQSDCRNDDRGGRRGQVRFRILGPLQVEDVGGPVALGGPKPRLLLAVLIVAAGEVVPADRLVAALWRDAVPPGAVTALRAYVSRLRSVLAPGAVLRHRPPGYCLTLDGGTLDAAEFEQLVGAGRAAAAGGDHVRALTDLDAALALWRGEALAE